VYLIFAVAVNHKKIFMREFPDIQYVMCM